MQAAKQKRDPSIRTRLRRIILVPTAALVALWLVASGYLAYNALLQYMVARGTQDMLTPAAVALTAVMDERSATIAYLEEPSEYEDALRESRGDSDVLMEDALTRFEGALSLSSPEVQDLIISLRGRFDTIPEIRAQVDSGQATRADVLEFYNALMKNGSDLFDLQSREIPAANVVGIGMSATYTFRTVDLLAQADSQLARAFATGELSTADQQAFTRLVGAYHQQLDSIRDFMGPEQAAALTQLDRSPEWAALGELEDQVTSRQTRTETDPVTGQETENLAVPISEEEWREAYTPVKQQLVDMGASQAMYAGDVQIGNAVRAVSAFLGMAVGVAVICVLAFRFALRAAHTVSDRLNRLRDETQELADRRLPGIMERLGRNEPVDVAREVPELSHSDDEIGEVARSFNAAQRTAVAAAVQQAELREGVNKVFLNIAHRSQTLVHRQLRLLDKLEREQEDPDQLTELFKLDHLATRSRRNAENLLILGGETPGRTWHRPMPLIDVLRSAISESGDYTRVKRQRIARVWLSGPAVADVIHLVAELVDNATAFSPPHTNVHLRSEQVPNGVTVEIEDRGLGMKDEEFTDANELLANPPEFDVMRLNEKMRLGLFVVSRLAQRHGIKVRLRASPYGGVQAIVLLPSALVSTDEPPASAGAPAGEAGSARRDHADAHGADDDRDASTGPRRTVPRHAERGAHAAPPAGDVLAGPGEPDPAQPARTARPSRPRRVPGATLPTAGTVWSTGPNGAPAAGGGPEGDSSGARPEAAPQEPAPDGAPAGGRPRLPKRQPQANLAPQLYDSGPTSAPGPAATEDPERSQRLRRNMAAFQQGTRRGRADGRQHQNETEKDA
ncbi:sensor histidine kinase [Marinitenerispora sediminis]|uniref:histidine kinase n=2 Tax=Marinitenerispora sediminis TaxID=1931232 RepID=A0A368TAK0_9ACTN|nr:nitrate- and nitrite sensing domain-containing protein [Marinitenerispora sediminis]RCV61997.1 ATP-binding protein [Marinitenerispora sediminis]